MSGKAIIAMSGGVDSSVAACLMGEQGFQCIGVTFKLFTSEAIGDTRRSCCSALDVEDARQAARKLGMPHYTINAVEDFKRHVIERFIAVYREGATPNPCIDCNRHLKFKRLLLLARQLDFEALATGHYARIAKAGDRFLLKKARDPKKDQSYALYTATQDQLARLRFPLGGFNKQEVREIARKRGLGTAEKQDSQDICFVPDGDYAAFIERYTGEIAEGGDIIDEQGTVLGRHRGLIRYTIGQRRGLGLAFPEKRYVAAKSVAANTLTLAPETSLYTKTLTADRINLIACAGLSSPLRVKVKTRYLQAEQDGMAEQTGPDTLRVVFDQPQRAVTAGQAVVLYDGDVVIGGGTIL
ncbi:MAG: tRNA 2-thiouridine(34) synthase MnmA [Treponema sp.]|jgi:tRNA-specific 2-thiouridylase|nr:tRNA 2-thiouridine(34) synthase MnmA [Treponema sp.]